MGPAGGECNIILFGDPFELHILCSLLFCRQAPGNAIQNPLAIMVSTSCSYSSCMWRSKLMLMSYNIRHALTERCLLCTSLNIICASFFSLGIFSQTFFFRRIPLLQSKYTYLKKCMWYQAYSQSLPHMSLMIILGRDGAN